MSVCGCAAGGDRCTYHITDRSDSRRKHSFSYLIDHGYDVGIRLKLFEQYSSTADFNTV